MATVTSKNLKKTYYPARTFDDDLDAFAQLAKTENWSFSNVDLVQLTQDATDQRNERAQYEAVEAQYNKEHEIFGLAQEARYERFATALNAARGAFRNNKAVMAQLNRFNRSARRAAKTPAPANTK